MVRRIWFGKRGGEGLPTLEDMATEIEPLERSMVRTILVRGLSSKDHGGCAFQKVRNLFECFVYFLLAGCFGKAERNCLREEIELIQVDDFS